MNFYKKLLIINLLFLSFLFSANKVSAYVTTGYLVSTNLISSGTSLIIDDFTYNASSIPSGTALYVQFSKDAINWFSSAEVYGNWDTLSSGSNTIDLTGLGWGGSNFFYKIKFTSDGTDTPLLDSINVSFHSYLAPAYDTYPVLGTITSTNLLTGETVTAINSFTYNISSVPSGTGLTVQFSQDNSTWYNSAGVLDGSDTLATGTNEINLSALDWSGANFYYKMTFTSDASDTSILDSISIAFTSDDTAPTTSDDFTNNDTWVNANQTITLTETDDNTGVASTKYCTDTDNTCVVSSGTAYTVPVVISTEGVNYFRYSSTDNAGNIQTTVSRTVKIDTNVPTTSDNFTNNDIWVNSNQTITLTPADTGDSEIASTKYCVDTDNTCVVSSGTAYTVPVVISTEGVSYFRYSSTDNAGNIQTTVSRTVKIDTAIPVITVLGSSPISINTGSVYTDAGATAVDSRQGDVTADIVTINGVNTNVAGTYYIYYDVSDTAGNLSVQKSRTVNVVTPTSTSGSIARATPSSSNSSSISISINNGARVTNNSQVTLNLSAPGMTAIMFSTNPDFSPATTLPYSSNVTFDICKNLLTCLDGSYTVYAKFLNPQGISSPAVSVSIILDTTSFITKVTNTAKETTQNVKEIIDAILPTPEPVAITFPPTETSVPKIAQDAFKHKWDIVSITAMNNFVLTSLPNDFQSIANKFPEVKQVLKEIGITKMSDAIDLTTTAIYLPGFSESIGLKSDDNLTVADLSAKQKDKMPSDIVFVRSADEKIDLNTKLSVTSDGLAMQTLNTIQGQTLKLVIKPEEPAKKVEGYMIFKSDNTAKKKSIFSILSLGADVANAQDSSADLVLTKFEYKESGDGIWTSDVATPLAIGKYELRTLVNYEADKKPKEISMVVVVDPEGYVYEKTARGKETRLDNAKVSIYVLNKKTKEYSLWPATDFSQKNPQTTDATGRYAFLVPVGTYYLKAVADGYGIYQSEPFKVEESKGVFMNIELKAKWSIFSIFGLQNIFLGGIFVVLVYLAYIFTIRRRRQT